MLYRSPNQGTLSSSPRISVSSNWLCASGMGGWWESVDAVADIEPVGQ